MTLRTITRQLLILAGFAFRLPAQISLVGAGYTIPTPPSVAPGQIITFSLTGLKTLLAAPQWATTIPLPTSLGGISVSFQQGGKSYPAPLFLIQQTNLCQDTTSAGSDCFVTGITLQVPFEIIAEGFPIIPLSATVSESGVTSKSFTLTPVSNVVHVITTCDSILGTAPPAGQGCTPIVTHADGSAVSASSPAAGGETVVIYATGLGVTNPPVQSGVATPLPAPRPNDSNLSVGFDWAYDVGPSIPNALPSVGGLHPPSPSGWLTPGLVGLYVLNITIPSPSAGLLPCLENIHSNLTISIVGSSNLDGAPICVQPPQGPVESGQKRTGTRAEYPGACDRIAAWLADTNADALSTFRSFPGVVRPPVNFPGGIVNAASYQAADVQQPSAPRKRHASCLYLEQTWRRKLPPRLIHRSPPNLRERPSRSTAPRHPSSTSLPARSIFRCNGNNDRLPIPHRHDSRGHE